MIRSTLRRVLVPAVAALVLAAAWQTEAAAATHDIDSGHTSVVFKIGHLGIAPFYGSFNRTTGTFEFRAGELDASATQPLQIALTIDARSIFTADKRRDQHLKSPDFFNTKQFPQITFKSTKTSPTGKTADGKAQYKVDGVITVRGVSKPLSFTLTHTGTGKGMHGEHREGFEAEFTLKRSEFGMSYMVGPLTDEVRVMVAVEGVKK